ncbi:ArpU family phage packaging/lysis transcriptional regulator [uncultured Granulicatella sp.]|uniref:ArpU family phage packaging/lysis transcriptional regulator n=1 Tax=uncultured Granulicatella sp. TaxID=316089 RepID=UPI0028E47D9E|nr:ArpU family phage packaging/lysis transcriptional regulator [uncultured Granulicatella sp.]
MATILVRKLDKRATKEKVVMMLSAYKQLKKIAGEEYVSKVTATYSFEPRSYTGAVNKSLEKHIERKLTAQKMVEDIEKAINRMSNAYLRQILIMKYCKYYDSDIAIYVTLDISESEFYRELERGLLYFAECFCNGSLLVFEGGLNIDELLLDLGELTK